MIIRRLPSVPSWTTRFHDFEDVRREVDRLFGQLSGLPGAGAAGVYPAINVTEDPRSLFVRAELPGVKAENLDIRVENDILSIGGERKIDPERGNVRYHRRERDGGVFRRAFQLPVPVDAAKVNARYENGILTIELPKVEAARPRQIPVQTI